jgi:hypothetical protein
MGRFGSGRGEVSCSASSHPVAGMLGRLAKRWSPYVHPAESSSTAHASTTAIAGDRQELFYGWSNCGPLPRVQPFDAIASISLLACEMVMLLVS